ncbi:glutamate-5-semialdehyde dehydrogenase [Clostridiaceae bacterium HSG29]|nr:glutamate-5-semialdehyde dehydrogenase [Clostridiaceae bacterium HSG29]
MDNYVIEMGKLAKKASYELNKLDKNKKNGILLAVSEGLLKEKEVIFLENEKDVENGKNNNLSNAMIDRLIINEKRLISMSEGLITMASLEDPIGEVLNGFTANSGLNITKVRVPIGVIGMIYESRPNVTVDAMGLAFKSGNAIILRGGSEAIHSNRILMKIINKYGVEAGLPIGACQLIEKTDRKYVKDLITMNDYVDVVIPRGGKGLKKRIVSDSTVPTIITGSGLCHMFVDDEYDLKNGVDIVVNAKVQRPGVCNAIETLLVHKDYAAKFLPAVIKELKNQGVEVVGCEETIKYVENIEKATEEDFDTEYLDLKISVKVVENIDDAIKHVNKYTTNHSESILTNNYENAERFLNEIDASTVYVNSSTRFTDGGEFGFGGEIGISTQKLHARGPMGLKELTTYKYLVRGNGQIRK